MEVEHGTCLLDACSMLMWYRVLKHFVVLAVESCLICQNSVILGIAYIFKCSEVPIYCGNAKEPKDMPRRNELEHKALHLIANTGNQGVLQSEMWRKLDASSREGSRISLKLEKKGLIRRTRELCGGRWTYRLYIKRQPASINSIINCPCLMCPEDPRCGVWSTISPTQCEELSKWISGLVQGEMNPSGET
ncbi:MAG: hypothetical protein JSW19_01620 [Candidatus Bathyarchaeota archaeon]|nr:MAG: hypothetical protein JSV75_04590 [Candidatus Bathyarchaeota archaeon]UCE57915.1 MAG: hypothetical protein JSW19_01620 [Candidatus Bathyarchaeota archaeon]